MQSSKDMLSLAIEIAQLVAEAEQSGSSQMIDEGKGLLLAILEGEEISPTTIDALKIKLERRHETESEDQNIEVEIKAFAENSHWVRGS
jgi:hypothetical protein